MAKDRTRLLAARILHEMLHRGGSANRLLAQHATGLDSSRDRAFLQELVLGACRWYYRLQAVAAELLNKPLRKQDGDVNSAIIIGLYQLLYTRVPEHAAISESVNIARGLGKPWARSLINAVLRNFLRRRGDILDRVDAVAAQKHAFPEWLYRRIEIDWPAQVEVVAAASNVRPPMVLRVNLRRGSREDYLRQLEAAGIEAGIVEPAPAGIHLRQALDVETLPGFSRGMVSVQDAAAQLASSVLALEPGQRILDACAAPGGKTGAILEAVDDLDVVALDVDSQRCEQINENLTRLALSAHVVSGDAATPGDWWDGRAFDRILVDAPCSGSGVLRRHPDIKILRKQEDIAELAARQSAILDALWPLLNPGGRLVYATCSILKEENELRLDRFLAANADARVVELGASWGQVAGAGRQILTGEKLMDGFYYGCVEKES